MHVLEVFFDYACPYCLQGHEYLEELIPLYPGIEISWCPCEAHPRPERYGRHSDLCIQGMYYAMEKEIYLWEYHKRMYTAALIDRADIENPNILVKYVKDILKEEGFLKSITSGTYEKAVHNANHYAYQKSGVWAVPSYRMNGRKLDSVENIGVSKLQLKDFLENN